MRPSAKYSLLGLLVVGFFSGIIFWGGFNTGMEATNTMDFCIGCHEMRDNVYEEYKTTIHLQQPHRCARCLLRLPCAEGLDAQDDPQGEGELKEVWGKLTGKIDTKEKFEATAWRWRNASGRA